MAALGDLLAQRSSLSVEQTLHVQRLVGQWQLLADLSFADLLLWLPIDVDSDGRPAAFLCVAQCRPTTGQTAYLHDEVGSTITGARAMPLQVAFAEGRIFREGDPDWDGDLPIRREAIPIRVGSDVVAVLGRDSNLASVRSPSQLELVYLQSAADLAIMVADGTFPGDDSGPEQASGPRAGDGLIRVERDSTIIYASPNAISALRRLGIGGNVLGEPIGALASSIANDPFDAGDLAAAVDAALAGGSPTHVELDGGGATVLFRALPLRPAGEPLGALVLLQDNTELRRRDLALLSKDATIREIHHRVKNNLQTVAALLRLQARRVVAPEARLALQESMRRIASIALVHETLSVSLDESVPFDDIVDRLLVMLSDVTGAGERIRLSRDGSFGAIAAEIATSLVLVLTELIQNATEHAFTDTESGAIVVQAARRGGMLVVMVIDDGVGLPDGFTADGSDRLGLQIVQTLVSAELGGTFEIHPRSDGLRGTEVRVTANLQPDRR
ncbi:two-component sensor histidine kinase [Jatrophihabitans sp. GAS493]|uniref:sensor histidine kinase n=1 Tax=Jatrophihabitans sp. GAS493 TaxID=1907575 RepID=UPI000BB9005B|nr:PAS domain-containing sensor histidine kinase [Jatrophihabitans sp. GAS493]SOD73250.1 two-component sensor histidine kinase [Jatrophihabitans sp. GAS493]